MKTANPRNMAASVRQRLMNHASSSREDFQVVLAQFGFERLLYRLGRLHPVPPFTVKGALLFRVWTGEQYRPTRDLDLACPGPLAAEELETIFRNACAAPVADDGLVFEADAVRVEPIREDTDYGGMRVSMEARLERARIPLQIDIGFGDAITPRAVMAEFPALLDFPAPRLAVYPRETAVAEKVETMVRRGLANSRMKDYYDVWALAKTFDFDGDVLRKALRATFRRRKTPLPDGVPDGLSDGFARDSAKQTQWTAFARRTRLKLSGADLTTVVETVRAFVAPPLAAASKPEAFRVSWRKGEPWR